MDDLCETIGSQCCIRMRLAVVWTTPLWYYFLEFNSCYISPSSAPCLRDDDESLARTPVHFLAFESIP